MVSGREKAQQETFEAEVYNANLSKSFVETVTNVSERPGCGTKAVALQSANKQHQDVTIVWNEYHEVWQYSLLWQPS